MIAILAVVVVAVAVVSITAIVAIITVVVIIVVGAGRLRVLVRPGVLHALQGARLAGRRGGIPGGWVRNDVVLRRWIGVGEVRRRRVEVLWRRFLQEHGVRSKSAGDALTVALVAVYAG